MTRAQGWDRANTESIEFLTPLKTDAIPRSQFANSEGALRLWALPSQDAGQAAHEL
jgi:hypothetical protein